MKIKIIQIYFLARFVLEKSLQTQVMTHIAAVMVHRYTSEGLPKSIIFLLSFLVDADHRHFVRILGYFVGLLSFFAGLLSLFFYLFYNSFPTFCFFLLVFLLFLSVLGTLQLVSSLQCQNNRYCLGSPLPFPSRTVQTFKDFV